MTHRTGRRLVLGCALLLALYTFRVSLLRALAAFLIVQEPATVCECVLVYEGDSRFDRAATHFRSGQVLQVLLVERYSDRLHRIGMLSSDAAIGRRALEQRGVPVDIVFVLPGEFSDPWDMARGLDDWLGYHPGTRVSVLCNRFDSRRLAYVLRKVLRQEAERVHLEPLADSRYRESDWWTTTAGVRAVANAYLRLCHAWFHGEDSKDEWREYEPS